MQQILAGEKPSSRRKGYISLNKRLLSLVLKYSKGSYEMMDYINGIAHNLSLDTRRWKLTPDQAEGESEIEEIVFPQPKKRKLNIE